MVMVLCGSLVMALAAP
nr:hypothetical protein [Vibrio cholerae]